MRILFLSNFYPPARAGGYTELCHEVSLGLKSRGHEIGVLTSRFGLENVPPAEKDIYRLLYLDADLKYYKPVHFFTSWSRQQSENHSFFRKVIADFSPDLIFVWGMWALSLDLPAVAERLLGPKKVVYYLADYWPSAVDMHTAYWTLPTQNWYSQFPKRILSLVALSRLERKGKPGLRFRNAVCVSAALREILVTAGLPLSQAKVVYNGIEIDRFLELRKRCFSERPLRLLYAGQVAWHKGVHTALEALESLAREQDLGKLLHLTILGSGHPDYERFIRHLVSKKGLQENVSFHDPVSRNEMPSILGEFDILVFPSIYEEPLARMTQEAMAAGLVVVGTTTGGTKELLVDGKNGLTFAPEDADSLACQIKRLANDPDLCEKLSEEARRTVLEKFTLKRMIDEIEEYLLEVLASPACSPR